MLLDYAICEFTSSATSFKSCLLSHSYRIRFQLPRVEHQIETLEMEFKAGMMRRNEEHHTILDSVHDNGRALGLIQTSMDLQTQGLTGILKRSAREARDTMTEFKEALHMDLTPNARQRSRELGPTHYARINNNYHDTIIISARPTRPQSTSCQKLWCRCNCHQRGIIRTPKLFEQFIGNLFVGYSDIPHVTPDCNKRDCKRRRRLPSMRLSYFFPTWFWARMLTVTMMYSPRDGLELHRLRVPRIIPPDSTVFRYAEHGDINGIKSLLTNGLASPYDLDQDGFSVTWVRGAFMYLHFVDIDLIDHKRALDTPTPGLVDICRLLLQEGADPHESVTKRFVYTSIGFFDHLIRI